LERGGTLAFFHGAHSEQLFGRPADVDRTPQEAAGQGERGTGDRPGRTASGQVGAPAAAVSGTPVQPVCSDARLDVRAPGGADSDEPASTIEARREGREVEAARLAELNAKAASTTAAKLLEWGQAGGERRQRQDSAGAEECRRTRWPRR